MQFIKYGIVGGLAFCIDFVLLCFFSGYCSLHYLVSATISFTAGLVVNYLLSVKYVFHNHRLNNRHNEFYVFALIGAIGLLINDAIMYLITDAISMHYVIAKPFSSLVVLVWNFTAKKYILFPDKYASL